MHDCKLVISISQANRGTNFCRAFASGLRTSLRIGVGSNIEAVLGGVKGTSLRGRLQVNMREERQEERLTGRANDATIECEGPGREEGE